MKRRRYEKSPETRQWVLALLLILLLLAQSTALPLAAGPAEPPPEIVPPPTSRTPVILVPGLGASWNWEVLLDTDIPFVELPWDWALPGWPVAREHWVRLIAALEAAGYMRDVNYFVAFYDWRKDNDWRDPDNGKVPREYLMETVDAARQQWEIRNPGLPPAAFKVNLVAHSLGGLVVRSYVESPYYRGDVNQVITVGSPHQGAADAYYTWEGGEVPPRGDVVTRFLWSLYLQLLQWRHGQDPYTLVHQRGKVAWSLLPVGSDYLVRRDGTSIPWQSMVEVNRFLAETMPRNGAAAIFAAYGITLTVVAGTGTDTTRQLRVDTDTADYYPRWQDGKPEGVFYGDGDGTVLAASAVVPGVRQIILPDTGHGDLVNAATEQILELLGVEVPAAGERATPGAPLRAGAVATPRNILAVFASGMVDLQLRDAAGNPVGYSILPPLDGFRIIAVPDLRAGSYSLTVTGTGVGAYRLALQLFEQGQTVTEEIAGTAALGATQSYRLTYRPGATRPLRLGPDRVYLPLVTKEDMR